MMRLPDSISAMADFTRRISLPLYSPRTMRATVLGSPMSILNTVTSARRGAGTRAVTREATHVASAIRKVRIIVMAYASPARFGRRLIARFHDLVDHDQLLRLERHGIQRPAPHQLGEIRF